jgi:transcriptional repressor AefR-like protein
VGAQVLASFGAKVVREASDPTVIAVFQLAISEVIHAPEVARALDSIARERSRAALRKIMAGAQASGLCTGRPAELANQFAGLLWRDLQVSLLLGVAERPNAREIERRARDALAALIERAQLYEIASVDFRVMAIAIVVLVVAACIAGMIPARRAASINPVQALRVE